MGMSYQRLCPAELLEGNTPKANPATMGYAIVCHDCGHEESALIFRKALDARDFHSFDRLHQVRIFSAYKIEGKAWKWFRIESTDGAELS